MLPRELLAAAFHLLEFLGFLIAIGSLVVLRLSRLTPRLAWAEPRLRNVVAGTLAGVLGLVVAGPPKSLLIGAVHLLSAGMWAGGILVMATLRPPGGWTGREGRELIERFARIALIAFGVTALTRVIQATDRLRDVSDLWTTAYGAVLSLKVAGFFAMSAFSLAWRRGVPAARFDAAAGVLVVALTAVLAAFPAQA